MRAPTLTILESKEALQMALTCFPELGNMQTLEPLAVEFQKNVKRFLRLLAPTLPPCFDVLPFDVCYDAPIRSPLPVNWCAAFVPLETTVGETVDKVECTKALVFVATKHAVRKKKVRFEPPLRYDRLIPADDEIVDGLMHLCRAA